MLGTEANSVRFSNELDLLSQNGTYPYVGASCIAMVASTAYMWLWSGV